jgi:transcriptional regulator GlxA family with amidase domain
LAQRGERRTARPPPPGRDQYFWEDGASAASPWRTAARCHAPGREYVDAHLGGSMDLATLAGVVGVSIHHFARGFKHSTGITPHHYLTQKRVERAQHLLADTELSLSEIAYAVGFSDQSHLARHFRQMLGVTPGQFRWAQR